MSEQEHELLTVKSSQKEKKEKEKWIRMFRHNGNGHVKIIVLGYKNI